MAKLVGIVAALGALAVIGVAVAASTTTYSYRATLTPKNEVPAPNAPAKAAGVFTATVTDKKGKASIRWTLTFRRLSGKAVAAHIHKGAAGVAGPVVVPLCGPCCGVVRDARAPVRPDEARARPPAAEPGRQHRARRRLPRRRGHLSAPLPRRRDRLCRPRGARGAESEGATQAPRGRARPPEVGSGQSTRRRSACRRT